MDTLALIGDIHLSERSPRYQHALEMLCWTMMDALSEGATHFFFLGDIFEGRPSPREYADFIKILLSFASHGGYVGICRGNHEDYEALSFFEALNPTIVVAWDGTRSIQLKSVRIFMIPYPTRHKAPYDQLNDGGTIAGGMRAAADRIGTWVRDEKEGGAARWPLLVLGHFTIEGMTTRDTEFELHQSNEVVVPVTAFEPAALTVVGHIHRAQEVTPTVIGAGDLYRCSFAEADDEKSYILVRADQDGLQWERRPVPARPMLAFKVELDAITADWVSTVAAAAQAQGAEVKITVEMDEEQAPRYARSVFDPIESVSPHLVVERTVRPTQRVRAPQISVAMDVRSQLEAWLRATQQDVVPERVDRLIQKFDELPAP